MRSSPAPSSAMKAAGTKGRGTACRAPPSLLPPEPPPHVPDLVDEDVAQAHFPEQLRCASGTLRLGTGGSRDRRQRGLAGEGHLVGALDVMARGAHALVSQQPRDQLVHRYGEGRLTPARRQATLVQWTSAS